MAEETKTRLLGAIPDNDLINSEDRDTMIKALANGTFESCFDAKVALKSLNSQLKDLTIFQEFSQHIENVINNVATSHAAQPSSRRVPRAAELQPRRRNTFNNHNDAPPTTSLMETIKSSSKFNELEKSTILNIVSDAYNNSAYTPSVVEPIHLVAIHSIEEIKKLLEKKVPLSTREVRIITDFTNNSSLLLTDLANKFNSFIEKNNNEANLLFIITNPKTKLADDDGNKVSRKEALTIYLSKEYYYDINRKYGNNENTLLHYATLYNELEDVWLLIAYGADITIKNKEKKTALELTTSSEIRGVIEDNMRINQPATAVQSSTVAEELKCPSLINLD